jgi:hypothetical protein
MAKLTFNETTYEFHRHHDGRKIDNYDSLHIFVNGELRKVREQCSTIPQSIEECVELINEYEL